MTVQELIDLLQEHDPEAEVRIMSQEGWPFECSLFGVTTREKLADDDCECDRLPDEPHEEGCPAAEGQEHEDGLEGRDVFLVEGQQERYGSKSAWMVAQRY